jgi:regulator of protease activity HflC (stomatin/prohibitin superfamily)
MNDKAQSSGTFRAEAEAEAKKIETEAAKTAHVVAHDAESLISRFGWRLLLLVSVFIAQEAAVFVWGRMTGKPPPTHRGRVRGL